MQPHGTEGTLLAHICSRAPEPLAEVIPKTPCWSCGSREATQLRYLGRKTPGCHTQVGHVQRPAESHTLTHCSTRALSLQLPVGGFRKPIARRTALSCSPAGLEPGDRLQRRPLRFPTSQTSLPGGKPRSSRRSTGRGPCCRSRSTLPPSDADKTLTIHSRQPALSPVGKNCTRGLVALVTQSPRPRPGTSTDPRNVC